MSEFEPSAQSTAAGAAQTPAEPASSPDEPAGSADAGPAPADEAGERTVRTGHAQSDAVLDSLDGLDQRPVSEHVAVFEKAHEDLRTALHQAHGDAGS